VLSKIFRKVFSTFAVPLLIISCSTLPVTNNLSGMGQMQIDNNLKIKTTITGQVDFSGSFKTMASLTDVAVGATVSLINPADNVTFATGLTDSNGSFILNVESQFSVNQIFILEATKRIGGPGNFGMAVRTFLKWTGSGWLSITTPNILVNTKTTAISIMASTNPDISPNDVIGKLDRVNNESVLTPFGPVTDTSVNQVVALIGTALAQNQDPVSLIHFTGLEYVITSPKKIDQLLGSVYLYTDASGHLYRMNENGSQKTKIADPTSAISSPVLLSDHKTVVYMDNSAYNNYYYNYGYPGYGSNVPTVYAYNESTGTKTDLTSDLFQQALSQYYNPSCPSCYYFEPDTQSRNLTASPDNSKAAFRFSNAQGVFYNMMNPNNPTNVLGMYVVSANGARNNVTMNSTDLTYNGIGGGYYPGNMNDANIYWSPDSNKILFQGVPFNCPGCTTDPNQKYWFVTDVTNGYGSNTYFINNPMAMMYYAPNSGNPGLYNIVPKFSPNSTKVGFVFNGSYYNPSNPMGNTYRSDIFINGLSTNPTNPVSTVTSQYNDNFSFSSDSTKVAWIARHSDTSSKYALYVNSSDGSGSYYPGPNGFCSTGPIMCPDSNNPDCPVITPINCHDPMAQMNNPNFYMAVCPPPDPMPCDPMNPNFPACSQPLMCPGDAACMTPMQVDCTMPGNELNQLCTNGPNPFTPGPAACSGSSAVVLARDFTSMSYEPVWSPDSSKLAVMGSTETDGNNRLYLVHADNSAPKFKLSESISPNKCIFSKNSAKVIFESSDGNIYSVSASFTDSNPVLLTDGSNIVSTHPTKDRLLFTKGSNLYSMKDDGTNIINLGIPSSAQVKWYADGSKLYYNSGNTVKVVKADGTGAATVSSDGAGVFFQKTQ
jgi:hypothetical protein